MGGREEGGKGGGRGVRGGRLRGRGVGRDKTLSNGDLKGVRLSMMSRLMISLKSQQICMSK